ncbi:translocation/assembly module TamB domain-containing protein [Polaribacter sp.]|uniref:translocation/assembly module TamB domain-containing protein n=1 Tax=Polaribacter sp. TaxID=1920175 RepID=UPI003F6CB715
MDTINIELTSKKTKTKKYRFIRRLLRVFFGILVFLLLIILFIRSPWGQNIIVHQLTDYVSNKTNTKFNIDKTFVTLNGNLKIDGLFLEDKKGDTLVYSKSLEANLPLLGMIRGTDFGFDDIKWNGLKANIIRKDTTAEYNFQFLIDAFAPGDTETPKKENNSASTNIIIGNINLANIDVNYIDIPLGIESSFKIGNLNASTKNIDLETMNFGVNEILLSDSNIKYTQNAVVSTSSDEGDLPNFSSEKITFKNTKFYYKDAVSELVTDLKITDFYSDNVNLNLNKRDFNIDEIALNDSKIGVRMQSSSSKSSTAKTQFQWPNVTANIAKVHLQNNTVSYCIDDAKIQTDTFNANAIAIQELNLNASSIFYKNQKGSLQINAFNFKESSGINLENLTLNTVFSNQEVDVNNFEILMANNQLKGNVKLNYNSITALLNTPEQTIVFANFPTIKLNLNKFLKFQSVLSSNPYLTTLGKKLIKGSVFANGTLSEINLKNTKIGWGNSTQISFDGSINNVSNPEFLKLKFLNVEAKTTKNDINRFVKEESLGIQFPKKINVSGSLKGTLKNIAANLKLKSTQGNINIIGDFENQNTFNYDTEIKINNFKINELLQNNQLGEISATLKSKGKGKSLYDLDAILETNIKAFTLNNYPLKNANFRADFKNGKGSITSNFKDDNLNLNIEGNVILDSLDTKASLQVDVIGVDLEGLGLMKRNVKAGMDIALNFHGNLDNFKFDTNVTKGTIVYNNRSYLLGSIAAEGFIDQDTTAFFVKNKMIDAKLQSNAAPKKIQEALQNHFSNYFSKDTNRVATTKNLVDLKVNGKIAQTTLLKEVFLVNAKDIDTIDFSVDFNEAQKKLNAHITAPHINYSGNELDSLAFTMTANNKNFNFKLGFKDVKANPLYIPKTVLQGNYANKEFLLNFSSGYKADTLININTKITGSKDQLEFTINPKNLKLNKQFWDIPTSNNVVFKNDKLQFTDFKITKNKQSIEITHQLEKITKEHVAIKYHNFKLSEVFSYLNPTKEIATGVLNGEFVLENPFKDTGIIADLTIQQLKFLKTDFGKLSLEGKSLGENTYDFNVKLKEGDIDLDLTGDYFVENKEANLNANIKLNTFKMKALNTLSLGEIKETSGAFSGHFKVNGTTSNPNYKGDLFFTDATFNITKLNTKFTLKDEKLQIDNDGIYVNNFSVLDENKNVLKLSGKILTKSFINPEFDVKLSAKNFRVLNATKEDNPSLYGVASFNANANLTGDLQIPKLKANITLGKATNVTYVLPTSYASEENRDNVVVFVNRENPDAILTETEEQTATIKGFDISTQLKINKEAKVTVIIDKETGDNFNVSGDGDLLFTMLPNGNISLSGVYEVAQGHYELNLYNLVNRKFLLAPGGRVSWSGNPFDAKLGVKAIYKLETSASPLMAAQISNEDPSVKNKFKQVLPFNVFLNIDGELMQPKISFKLAMPEEEQGAIGGQVYSRVQQVNQQEEELNKQVFSLLVLNRFYPDSGSDGSSGGFATIARDNLNDAVAGQLNTFSNKILGNTGLELNFDLNSYTDYQGNTPTNRTELGVTAQKKLFNERLTVRVGSDLDLQGTNATAQQTPIIGNVTLEYKITEDGKYRLKGFRKNEFENIIDGQTIVSGIALIFTQEFNEFSEMWAAIFRSQKNRNDKNDEDEKKKVDKKTTINIEHKNNKSKKN